VRLDNVRSTPNTAFFGGAAQKTLKAITLVRPRAKQEQPTDSAPRSWFAPSWTMGPPVVAPNQLGVPVADAMAPLPFFPSPSGGCPRIVAVRCDACGSLLCSWGSSPERPPSSSFVVRRLRSFSSSSLLSREASSGPFFFQLLRSFGSWVHQR